MQETTKCKVHTPLLKATLHNRQVNGGLSFIMNKPLDLLGKKFGNLLVVEKTDKRKDLHIIWKCVCDCGNIYYAKGSYLKCGHITSCGCKYREKISSPYVKRLGKVYQQMKHRCYKKNDDEYYNYGGRGIKICEEWLNDFMAFYRWSVKNGYKEEMLPNGKNKWTIDRIDPDGDYCPENCRWITIKEQCNNKRIDKVIVYKGKQISIKDLLRSIYVKYHDFYKFIRAGYTNEEIIDYFSKKEQIEINKTYWYTRKFYRFNFNKEKTILIDKETGKEFSMD